MGGILHIDGHLVYGETETLRQLLADHTGSEQAAAALLAELNAARRTGAVQHVVVLPAKLGDDTLASPGRWRLRVTHSPLEVEP